MTGRLCRPFPASRTLRRLAFAALLNTCAGLTLATANSTGGQFYESALALYEKKDYAGAIIQLKNAITADRKMLPVHVLLGKAMLANGEVAGAEAAFNEALRLGVNRAEVLVPLAQALVGQARQLEVVDSARFDSSELPAGTRSQLLLVQAGAQSDLGRPAQALKAIEQARALDPQSAEPWLAEVPVQIRGQHFAEATAAAERAMALSPQSADAIYLRGSVSHAQGQAAKALSHYDQALQLNPAHAEARVARAGLMVDAGRYNDALPDLAQARKLSPQDPRPAYLKALIDERNGDMAAARAALASVTNVLDPVPVHFLRYRPQLLMLGGLAHHGLGQSEKARPYLESVVRQQPDSPAAKLLAELHAADKNHDRAVTTLEPYVKAHPGDKQALMLLAASHIATGRGARAAALLQDAIKADDSPHLRTFLGLTLINGGKRADALTELENAYRRDPNQVAAGAALADLYLSNRQPDKAVAIALALTRRQPQQAQFHTVLGVAQAQGGDAAKARASYATALQLDPAFTPAHLHLARLDANTGDTDAAVRRLNGILARDDKHVDALIELAFLAQRRGAEAEAGRLLAKATDHAGARALRPGLLLVDHLVRVGRADEASAAHHRLAGTAPDNLAVLMAGARVRVAQKDLAAAQHELTRASRLVESDPPKQVLVSMQQLAVGDALGAHVSLTNALRRQPDDVPAKAVLVDVNLRLNKLSAAEQLARDIAVRQPRLAVGHALLGDVALARGQLAAALEAYRRAHQIEPTSASVTRLHALTLQQDPAAAATLAEQWLQAHPRDAHVRRALADGHARSGSFAAARASYEALLTITPDDPDVLNNFANVLVRLKDPGALAAAERALARKPGAPHVMGTVGWAAFQAGQIDRALQMLREATLRDPGNADTRYFLGAVLASKNRTTEAREALQGALRNRKDLTYASQADALLKTLK